ncbi:cysteine synthase [Saccharomonospora marina XMU15]|uniref:Cysteine synthase n=1 Tax=Saccharomonospora marina XMU15 TaxID=882083 RepID=H5X7R8_9PSEU|nr:PLP-dependent cysteine synthase family protein [Saccharomonospora marina]EHR51361.1 cysteine synthase [Saccharomonospora marina XMU15]
MTETRSTAQPPCVFPTSTPQVGEVYRSVIEAMELPRIIQLTDNLYAAAFSLMKLLPARYVIDRAEAAGVLAPGTPVIETSSGSFGLGLAMVCRLRGYPLTIVGDSAIDDDLRNRLQLLNARIELVENHGAPGGIQGARLARVAELQREFPDSFVPGQYDNPANPAAYAIVGDLVTRTIGEVDCLVGAVGSGGSTCGLAASLRQRKPSLRLVGVDTHGSIIFGCAEGRRVLRGLGSSIIPGNVEHAAYDEVHWVSPAEAFHATHDLYRENGLFMGPTSGAAFQVASWWARHNPYSKTLMLLPDEGHRYQATVYSSSWLHETGIVPVPNTAGPRLVEHPDEAGDTWSRLIWARRSYESATGREIPA